MLTPVPDNLPHDKSVKAVGGNNQHAKRTTYLYWKSFDMSVLRDSPLVNIDNKLNKSVHFLFPCGMCNYMSVYLSACV